MAEKFPSLATRKHRVFGLDLARFGDRGGRAALVVAERSRLSLHWTRADGSWGVTTREHAALSQTPQRPDDTAWLGWSGRVGIAAAGDHVVLVYKRRFTLDRDNELTSSRELYLEGFRADANTGELDGGPPVQLPRQGLNIERFGFSVWADLVDGRLLIVAQIVRGGAPTLALLDTDWPQPDPAALQDPSAWRVTDLDAGGWDVDARREGPRLVVLHRRDPATHELTLPLVDAGFGGVVTVPLSDAANAPVRLSQLRRPSLTYVEVDLPTRAVTAVETDLGFGENPRIHLVTPFIASVDRLAGGTLGLRPRELRLEHLHTETSLLMRTRRGWRSALLFNQTLRWAITRMQFARVHLAVALAPAGGGGGLRVSWAPLWSERPIELFSHDEAEKGRLLTFAHQDPDLAALRATTFRVFEDDGGETLRAMPEQFAVLDLGHRHIVEPNGGAALPLEHRQLRPGPFESAAFHGAVPNEGLRILRVERSGNTLAGVLAATVHAPASGHAYTDMGDGGVRVVFEAGLDVPPPTATIEEKIFAPEWVAEPALPGRAWVRFATPEFVDTDLPGVFTPAGTLPPTSLACLQQQALDGLILAASNRREGPLSPADPTLFALGTGVGRLRYSEVPTGADGELVIALTLDPDAAALCQDFATGAATAAPPRPAVSDGSQPFVVELHRVQGLFFAGEDVTFTAALPAEPAAGVTFTWAFSDGTTAAGDRVSHAFTATRPDFSRPAPGAMLPDHVVTLTATAADGRVSTVSTGVRVERSLWATLWNAYSAFRRAPDNVLDDGGDWSISEGEWASYLTPGLFARDVTMSFYRYQLRFVVDATGRGTRVDVSVGTTHAGRFRCLGRVSGQGDVEYEIPVDIDLREPVFTGQFGSGLGVFIRVSRLRATLRARQRFTPGVQTSERRDRFDQSENLERRPFLQPRTMVPAALAALPVGMTTHEVGALTVDGGLSGVSWGLGVVVGAVVAALGTAAVLAVLLPILPVAAPIVGALTVSLVVSALVGAGLAAVALLALDFLVVRPLIRTTFLDALSTPDVTAGLRGSGLIAYAGEGLAEALAIRFIRQAESDGLVVSPPTADGRNRNRTPFFETVVVSEGAAKALIRVGG